MASKRTIVLMRVPEPGQGPEPLGSPRDVLAGLARFNTMPDGSGRGADSGLLVLYGPGMVVEVPTSADEVNQALVTLVEEDVAWPVLLKACRALRWTMADPETGRTFGGAE